MFEEQIDQFSELPEEIQEAVSGDEAVAILQAIEQKYGLELSLYVIRVTVGDILLADLPHVLAEELKIDDVKAAAAAQELKNKIFIQIKDYLDKLPVEGFSVLDQKEKEEIHNLQSQVNLLKKPRSLEEIVNEIVREARLSLVEERLVNRFKKAVLLRLKDIRDNLETYNLLSRPVKIGGLGLDENTIDDILGIIQQKMDELTAEEMSQLRVDDEKNKAVELAKSEEAAKKTAAGTEPEQKQREIKPEKFYAQNLILDVEHELMPPPPALVKKEHLEPEESRGQEEEIIGPSVIAGPDAVSAGLEQKKESLTEIKEQPLSRVSAVKPEERPELTRRQTPRRQLFTRQVQEKVGPMPSARPKLEDIKFVPKLTGPLEELLHLNLVDFRRLSPDPRIAGEKIRQQLDLLAEEDSLTKKLEGIKNFRASDLFQLYLKMGQDSLWQKKSIEAIIAEWQTLGQPVLKKEEFEAIMELNNKLRY